MKCAACYEENPPWQAVCSRCGQHTRALQLCPSGHLLPPGVEDCPVCPSMWPDPGPFKGAPILRGIAWVESGHLRDEEIDGTLPVLELRDNPTPFALSVEGSASARRLREDLGKAAVQILVRPDGIRYCLGANYRGGDTPSFVPIEGERVRVGNMTLRVAEFEVPGWVRQEFGTR